MGTTHLPTNLTEAVRQDGSALRVDEEACVIFGARILGRFSPNCHGVQGVTEGTEYAPAGMRAAIPLYEGRKSYCDHTKDRKNSTRSVHEPFAVFREVKYDGDGECLRANMHYLPDHPMARNVVQDVKRGLGIYGLSHDASAGKSKVVGGRFVVEEITAVRSVDLVDDPATSKNLWESRTVTTTFKAILEARLPKLSAARQKVGRKLLEDGELPPAAMDAPVDATDTPVDSDEALAKGFKAAIMAVVDDDSLDLAAKKKKIGDLLTSHDKLTADPEPADAPGDAPADDTTESLERTVKDLQAKDACRTLCEAIGFLPTADQLTILTKLDDAASRKQVAESFKGTAKPAAGGNNPRSGAPAGKPLTEGRHDLAEPKDAKEFAALLRG